jgi:hypothetical protein
MNHLSKVSGLRLDIVEAATALDLLVATLNETFCEIQ